MCSQRIVQHEAIETAHILEERDDEPQDQLCEEQCEEEPHCVEEKICGKACPKGDNTCYVTMTIDKKPECRKDAGSEIFEVGSISLPRVMLGMLGFRVTIIIQMG